jgi:hypothetical protein
METQVIEYLVLGAFTLVLWFFKMNITETKEKLVSLTAHYDDLKTELGHVKLNYLHRDDFKEFKLELRSMFEEIREDVKALRSR